MTAKAWPTLLLGWVLAGCGAPADDTPLFTLLHPRESGVAFENTLTAEVGFNLIAYLYFYDGGGVALGDINRDGLQDIFLTGNQVSNRLYLNRGHLHFEDVTVAAGLESTGWSTGATMADINGDQWLDIYVCQVNYKTQQGRNLLYLNNQDGTFTEAALQYGLAFEGLSTQAAFFDYDRDHDLDMYLLNHSVHTGESFAPAWRRTVDAPRVGDRLYRNEGGGAHFTNVTSSAGIFSSALGYGLGLAVSDLNDDGWPDIYVGNDFHEDDYLYLNRGDGTFEEVLRRAAGHTSQSTMGVDIADLNGDGWPEIVALDMMPEDWSTVLASGGPDIENIARIKRDLGYGSQVPRNTLQLHRGLTPEGTPRFSEIGAFLGLHATDWSWSPLAADLDGDGWKDIWVTNGIVRRPNDLDYIDYIGQPDVQRQLATGSAADIRRIMNRMPEAAAPNYAFRNNGDTSFVDVSAVWGLDLLSVSNGAAYADLDNDGDLDLVANNINMPAHIYRNNSTPAAYASVELAGEGLNTSGVGARVSLFAGGRHLVQEHMPTRGFQSSVPHVLTFPLGTARQIDSLTVRWPSGLVQTLHNLPINQHLVLRESDAEPAPASPAVLPPPSLFAELPDGIPWQHQENSYDDLAFEPLIPHRLSTEGPAMAVADVDGDGQDDIFLGGAHGQAGRLLLHGIQPVSSATFEAHAASEAVDALFFDADGDHDPDLYVVHGGGEMNAALRQDRLYLNHGRGTFTTAEGQLPPMMDNGCCVRASDFDTDGDTDLFVGSRSVPGAYGARPRSYLLRNDGDGTFTDVTADYATPLLTAGMITDAVWADVTHDSAPDLVLVGEWMPVTILENRDGRLKDVTDSLGLGSTDGLWQSVLASDL